MSMYGWPVSLSPTSAGWIVSRWMLPSFTRASQSSVSGTALNFACGFGAAWMMPTCFAIWYAERRITWFSVMTVTVAPLIASTLTWPRLRAGLADLDLVAGIFADVLRNEALQRRFGNPEQQDRLAVLQDLDAGDDPFCVHPDQRHHRFAGIGRNVDDVGGKEDVADQPLVATLVGMGLDVARPALARREAVRARHDLHARRVRAQVRVARKLRRQLCLVRGGEREPGRQRDDQRCD